MVAASGPIADLSTHTEPEPQIEANIAPPAPSAAPPAPSAPPPGVAF
jgi:hypothetical protein